MILEQSRLTSKKTYDGVKAANSKKSNNTKKDTKGRHIDDDSDIEEGVDESTERDVNSHETHAIKSSCQKRRFTNVNVENSRVKYQHFSTTRLRRWLLTPLLPPLRQQRPRRD